MITNGRPTSVVAAPLSRRRVFLATSFGHLVEWYEFSVYGFVAVHIGASFFPGADTTTRLLATFGVSGSRSWSDRSARCSSARSPTGSAGARCSSRSCC
jgi:hypothetical protein